MIAFFFAKIEEWYHLPDIQQVRPAEDGFFFSGFLFPASAGLDSLAPGAVNKGRKRTGYCKNNIHEVFHGPDPGKYLQWKLPADIRGGEYTDEIRSGESQYP